MRRPLAVLLVLASLAACSSAGAPAEPAYPKPDGPTLRSLARGRIHLGAAVAASPGWDKGDPLGEDPAYRALLADQYDILVAENVMKFDQVEPSRGTFDFENADRVVAFARAHDMRVRGHTLLWHQQSSWLWDTGLADTLDGADFRDILETHVTTVVDHFRGQVAYWDVVNEALEDAGGATVEGSIRDVAWARYYPGSTRYAWIEEAFRVAHAADPEAKLFYNDYGTEALGSAKGEALYRLVQQLLADGVPIHGVGFQMHIGLGIPGGFAAQAKRFTDLGLEVHITELDVRIELPASAAELATQKDVYEALLRIALDNPRISAVVMWGVDDGHSWIPDYFGGQGAALPFDASYQAKPAFYGLREALAQ